MTFQCHTIKEAAKLARCSARLLSSNIRAGKLPATRVGRQKVIIRSDMLEDWLRRCTAKQAA